MSRRSAERYIARPAFMDAGQVSRRTGMSVAEINAEIARGTFPRPGVSTSGDPVWPADEVELFVAKRWLRQQHRVVG